MKEINSEMMSMTTERLIYIIVSAARGGTHKMDAVFSPSDRYSRGPQFYDSPIKEGISSAVWRMSRVLPLYDSDIEGE